VSVCNHGSCDIISFRDRCVQSEDVVTLFLPPIVCLNGLDAQVGWSRSSQCLISNAFEGDVPRTPI
jgi:hypothetical protein